MSTNNDERDITANLRYRVAGLYVDGYGEPITRERSENEFYHIDDYNQNYDHWITLDTDEETMLNRINSTYFKLKDILSTHMDTYELDTQCRMSFGEHFPSHHAERVYNAYKATKVLIKTCSEEDINIAHYISMGSSVTQSYTYVVDELIEIEDLIDYSPYNAENLWKSIRDYFGWILKVHETNDMLPVFFHTVVEHEDECVQVSDGTYVSDNNDSVVYSEWHGSYEWRNDCIYIENRDDWIREEETVYCDDCDEYRLDSDECSCDSCRETSDSANHLNDYHCSPNPEFKGILEGMSMSDIIHLRNLKRFSIGFEVEKSNIEDSTRMGTEIEAQPFFSGWETDSSCGVEGISHIYSLDDFENFSKDVDNSKYIDSLDTTRACGGHINIHDFQDKLRYWHLSAFMGVFYALWRYRLNRNYCSTNKKLNPYNNQNHYNVIGEKTKGGCKLFEIRIPSAVTSCEQLKMRYLVMQQFIQCVLSFMNEDFSYQTVEYDHNEHWCPDPKVSALVQDLISSECYIHSTDSMVIETQTVKRCRFIIGKIWHILEKLYRNNREKLPTVVFLTYCFQHWIDGNNDTRPTQSTSKYL